jgi:rubredoxin
MDELEAPPSNVEASGEGDSPVSDAPEILDPKQLDRFECGGCGYTYEPVKGDDSSKVPRGTAFEDLSPDWRCPVCGARKAKFSNIGPVGNPSGFKENLGYGFGVNTMTPGQKNILIFGALVVFFIFFISLYGLK